VVRGADGALPEREQGVALRRSWRTDPTAHATRYARGAGSPVGLVQGATRTKRASGPDSPASVSPLPFSW
jgi:hypothetical protein